MSGHTVSNALLHRVTSALVQNRLLHAGDKVVVAVSGGADSLALLYILFLIEMRLDLVAAYIEHGLRPAETPLETENIYRHCRLLKIPFIVEQVDVARNVLQTKRSPEESARVLRYNALEKIRDAHAARAVAVGHTADDQVEEFFIRLIRGSGLKGLSGMRFQHETIVRPLLLERKKDLQQFLTAKGISWSFDSSNDNRRFLRNRIRLDLLPHLESDFNPSMRKSVLQTMDILRVEDDYLAEQTKAAYKQCVVQVTGASPVSCHSTIFIKTHDFLALHPALSRRILERCFWQMDTRPSYKQINVVMKLVKDGENGSETHLPCGVRAVKHSGDVKLLRPCSDISSRRSLPSLPPVNMVIHETGTYPLPGIGKELILLQQSAEDSEAPYEGALKVDMANISFPLLLRSFIAGDRFYPCNSAGKRKIARFLNDKKIPARERPGWPVLLCEGKIIALPGLQVDHDYRVTADTKKTLTLVLRDLR